MSEASLWWIMVGITVGLELATGTFFLLMLASGMAVAALSAHAGASGNTQMLIAGLVDSVAILVWYIVRQYRPQSQSAQSNPDVNMDIGAIVQIDTWQPNGTATVKYRGAHWTAAHIPGQTSQSGEHQIVEIIGSRLIVQKVETNIETLNKESS